MKTHKNLHKRLTKRWHEQNSKPSSKSSKLQEKPLGLTSLDDEALKLEDMTEEATEVIIRKLEEREQYE